MTGTFTVLELAWKVTLNGTVATAVLVEARTMVNPPAGAGTDKVNVRFCVTVPVIVRVVGEKEAVPVTCTVWLAGE